MRGRAAIRAAAGLSLFLVGWWGLETTPPGVTRTAHTVVTADGVEVGYDLLCPAGPDGRRPLAVVGHGLAVDRTIMHGVGLGLAEAGLVVANLDWRGHGVSSGRLGGRGGLGQDLAAVLADVQRREPAVDAGRLILVGYSMGGGAMAARAAADPAVRAWVGVGAPAPAAEGPFPSALAVIGSWDQAFPAGRVRAGMAALAGQPDLPFGQTVGQPAQGTGRRAVRLAGTDHLLAPWHPATVAETVAWSRAALGAGEGPPQAGRPVWRLVLLGVGLAGLAGVLTQLAGFLTPGRGGGRPSARPVVPVPAGWREGLAALGGGVVGSLAAGGLLLGPLPFAAVQLMPVAGLAGAVAGWSWRCARGANVGWWRWWAREIGLHPGAVGLGAALGLVTWTGLTVLVGRHFLGVTPPGARWGWLVVHGGVLLVVMLALAELVQRLGPAAVARFRWGRSRPVAALAGPLLAGGWACGSVGLAVLVSGSLFPTVLLVLLGPILAVLGLAGWDLERRTASLVPLAVAAAVALAPVVTAIGPLIR